VKAIAFFGTAEIATIIINFTQGKFKGSYPVKGFYNQDE